MAESMACLLADRWGALMVVESAAKWAHYSAVYWDSLMVVCWVVYWAAQRVGYSVGLTDMIWVCSMASWWVVQRADHWAAWSVVRSASAMAVTTDKQMVCSTAALLASYLVQMTAPRWVQSKAEHLVECLVYC